MPGIVKVLDGLIKEGAICGDALSSFGGGEAGGGGGGPWGGAGGIECVCVTACCKFGNEDDELISVA